VQPSKTLWDVLQLLIVPAILSESASRGTAIEQMSDLMLTKNLLRSRSKPFSAVRSLRAPPPSPRLAAWTVSDGVWLCAFWKKPGSFSGALRAQNPGTS
jgi:hypothetical protein